jgi:nucleoside-diphosphate-sugar epimerase
VDAFILTAQTPTDDPGAVFNVGTGVQTSLQQLVQLVREHLRISAEPEWGSMPDRDWDTDVWVSDPASIRAAIRWKPAHELEAGLREFADWILSDQGIRRHYETFRALPQ